MRDHHIDLCGQIDFTRTEAMPLLARDAHFSFACNGCGDCCRGREDIVLSGFDLWRIAARLRLPPQIVARGYCRASIGTVSHLPVLRLAPVTTNNEVIAVSQDPMVAPAKKMMVENGQVWSKKLYDGSYAVGFFHVQADKIIRFAT